MQFIACAKYQKNLTFCSRVIHITLKELVYLQPSTLIHIDNICVVGMGNNTTKRQSSRSMEVPYVWLLDREGKKSFLFQHHLGQENSSEFHTKPFTSKGAQHAYLFYVHKKTSP